MKRKLLRVLMVLAVSFSLFGSQKARGQVMQIQGWYSDSLVNYCTTPATHTYNWTYYVAQGSPMPGDSIDVYINWGDGSDSTFKIEAQMGAYYSNTHTYTIQGSFAAYLYMAIDFATSMHTSYSHSVTDTCGSLQGTVWMDPNTNCTYDNGENYLTGHMIQLVNQSNQQVSYAMIKNDGTYAIDMPAGNTYDISLAGMPGTLTPVCPISGTATQTVALNTVHTNNFAYDCTGTTTDLSVDGWANVWRPGMNRALHISATTDNFCQNYPATVTLVLDNQLSYTSTIGGMAPSNVSGQTLTWNVSSLSAVNEFLSSIYVMCDSYATINSVLCNDLYISYTGVTDPDQANDTTEVCAFVSNSYDPNDKSVSPGGDGVGMIHNGDQLAYLINFQNTGNDTAYNITITDTLSSNVDASSFVLGEASHPVAVTWLPGNIIKFRFENIYLPDSNINEPLSHGYVSYKVKAKTGLTDGTLINNTAHIYFDFNTAIVTNTTINTIDIPLTVKNVSNGVLSAKVYPNPANNELTIAVEGQKNFSMVMYDVLGRPVSKSQSNSGKLTVNTSEFASGLYMLEITADGKELNTKLNIQH
jgi:uncharacterized repeat protein (TIGR01451 family)